MGGTVWQGQAVSLLKRTRPSYRLTITSIVLCVIENWYPAES